MSTNEKMAQAKSLIQQKRHDEARAILKTVNHPTAAKWLAKLDEIAPVKKPAIKEVVGGATILIVTLILCAAVIAFAVHTQRQAETASQLTNQGFESGQ